MVKTITRDQLIKLMGSRVKFKLVDVLDREHYDKEHIKSAISLPLNEIEEKAKNFLDKKEKIIVYCASFECQASTKAAKKLQSLGYQDVLDYKGGLKDYKEAELALEGSLHDTYSDDTSTCCCC
ncbi:MAG: rhodanese-like domain-containing protein [Candidatus Omnitrophica bacterium]|jgi:rhodanese-related sulfurtransferase|nr:rhodanese-like domain-containing protein [Candidatus Omnitrophota bacterium]